MPEKILTYMQEVPNLQKNYSSGAFIWGSVHPIQEIILLLNNIGMYNYTAVRLTKSILMHIVPISIATTFTICGSQTTWITPPTKLF